MLLEERGKSISLATLSRTLSLLRITHKQVPSHLNSQMRTANCLHSQLTKEAAERDPMLRAGYCFNVGHLYSPEQLVFTDECYVDKRSTARLNGWATAGQRAFVQRPFIRGKR
jgi:hypothetical protein